MCFIDRYRNHLRCHLLSIFSVTHSYIPPDLTLLGISYEKSLVLSEIKLIVQLKHRSTPLNYLFPCRTTSQQHDNLGSAILQVHLQTGFVPLSPPLFLLQGSSVLTRKRETGNHCKHRSRFIFSVVYSYILFGPAPERTFTSVHVFSSRDYP